MVARILIIEDNPESLELMRYLLAAHGHAVVVAQDGTSGVAQAEAESPDLILCDIQLPELDGFEVARRLKNNASLTDKPLVAVTALAMVGDRERVLAAGFDGYLTKPISPESFVCEVEAFLESELRSGGELREPVALATPAARVLPDPPRGLILVVDDFPDNLDLATSVLEFAGYRVATAGSVRDGLDLARRLLPDLILSDVNMAESGFEFIRAAKDDIRLCMIPFVFISSSLTCESARERGLALGAARYLVRPIDAAALLAEIEGSLQP